ncbi:MAG: hypothetical protein U0800_15735 [Isosphaeraceae bacterium]
MPEAKIRGYSPRRFSFNQAGGRCEVCEGAGQKRIEMHFLPDVWVPCDACGGARYTAETLAVKYKGRSIAEVLDMKVDAAARTVRRRALIRKILQTLHDVGLGYVSLGQAAPTSPAARPNASSWPRGPADTGRTLYLLDEPTTGLHMDDVRKLLDVVHRLADLGNTVILIEHNLDVIKTADWVIDMGPEAGAGGGEVVAEGAARSGREGEAEPHRVDPPGRPGSRPARRAAPVRPQGGRQKGARRGPQGGRRREGGRPNEGPRGGRWPEVAHPRSGRPQRQGRPVGRPDPGTPGRSPGRGRHRPRRLVPACGGPHPPARWSGDALFEAQTGHEWVLTVRFYLPPGTFSGAALTRDLDLKPFHEHATPVLSDHDRVRVLRNRQGFQEVVLCCHSPQELESPAFGRFLDRVAEAVRGLNPPAGSFRRRPRLLWRP